MRNGPRRSPPASPARLVDSALTRHNPVLSSDAFVADRAVVIVAAAGSGTRLGSQVPKVFLDLGGVPIIFRTLSAFAGVPEIVSRVVVLAREVCEQLPGELRRGLAALADVRVVAGGPRRQDSVQNGLAAAGEGASLVCVHDAARPFVDVRTIRAVLAAAAQHGAATAATPAADTLKRVRDGRVQGTLDRTDTWCTQTPQAFRLSVLREAHARAVAADLDATDDAMLVEALGHPVAVVAAPSRNWKITTPDDLALARALVAGQRAGDLAGATAQP